MSILRLLFIAIVGGFMLFLTCQSKYESSIGDIFLWLFLTPAGILLFISSIYKDIKNYRKERHIENFALSFVCFAFLITIITVQYFITREFDKPSLLKVFYDGDSDGGSIDFKLDGSFIFYDSTMLSNTYEYGKYTIKGNKIILDKKLKYLVYTKFLEIRHSNDNVDEKRLIQVDERGNILENETEFKVIKDNRK